MNIYLKGYYGYKNFGDELLLLGLLQWIFEKYTVDRLYIESGDKEFLEHRLISCKKHVKTHIDTITCVSRGEISMKNIDLTVFGGGEVMTDARPFPYNGWNYVLGHALTIYKRTYIVCGGIGAPEKFASNLLHKIFLGRAKYITLREETSYTRALIYNEHSSLYHDFCYDILPKLQITISENKKYILINVNKYLRNDDVKQKITKTVSAHPGTDVFFFPAARGSDDLLFSELETIVPEIRLLDRRDMSIEESVGWIAGAKHVCAARLHVLLVAQYFKVDFSPFVYQEKIEKCVLRAEQTILASH